MAVRTIEGGRDVASRRIFLTLAGFLLARKISFPVPIGRRE